MIKINNIQRTFKVKKTKEKFQALKGVTLEFPNTGFIFIIGKSGSGKSTLLNILGGLDKADAGEIIIKGKSSKEFKSKDFDSYRNTYLGFVFQEYNLLDKETIRKNIALALELQSFKGNLNQKVENIAKEVDLFDKLDNKITDISGGQKQRVAIARALVKNPEIIIADEPTGNLDSSTGDLVMDTLRDLSKTKLVIMVTHDVDYAAEYADRVIELRDGSVQHDETIRERSLEKVSSTKLSNGLIAGMRVPSGKKIDMKFIDEVNDIIHENPSKDLYISVLNKKDKISQIDPEIQKLSDAEKGKSEKITLDYTKKSGFKLIKSKFPNKDASKFGATNIWNRKVSLLFTFVLLILSLSMFGFSETARNFSFSDAIEDIINEDDIKTFEITKDYNSTIDLTEFSNKYGSNEVLQIYEVYGLGDTNVSDSDTIDCDIQSGSDRSTFLLPTCYAAGYTYINQNNIENYGYNNDLLLGTFPQINTNEVLITDYLADSLMKNNVIYDGTNNPSLKFIEIENQYSHGAKKITSYNDIIDSIIFNSMVVKGIIDTEYEKYQNIHAEMQSHYEASSTSISSTAPKTITESYAKWVSYKRHSMYPISYTDNPDSLEHIFSNKLHKDGTIDKIEIYPDTEYAIVVINDIDSLLPFFEELINDEEPDILLDDRYNSISKLNTTKQEVGMFSILAVVFKWFSIILLVFAGILLLSNISGSVLDRKRDIGTLRAIGARGTDVAKIFLFEALFISLFVSTISIFILFYISGIVNAWLTTDIGISTPLFNVTPLIILEVYGVGIIAAVISSILPAKGVSMMRPIDAIRNV